MRSTVDILDILDEELRRRAEEKNVSFKKIVNQVIAAGLRSLELSSDSSTPYRVRAKECGFRAGIDTNHLNQLVDELEDESGDNTK